LENGRVENKRSISIGEIPNDCSVLELHDFTSKVLLRYLDAKVGYCDDSYYDDNYSIIVQVDKTPLDLEIEAINKELEKLDKEVTDKQVVIYSEEPLSEEVLAPYRACTKENYLLHMSGCVLSRLVPQTEIDAKEHEITKKDLELRAKRSLLLRQQSEQDEAYKIMW
jgi:hypothetical protein